MRIPARKGDFVFFVTYGQQQGEHHFDEGISDDGVLRWQSQPQQGFDSDVIKELINHDETINNIYLFLRENKNDDYSYLGKLKYLVHDSSREKPVFFQWQLLDWYMESHKNRYSIEEPKKLVLTSKKPSNPARKPVKGTSTENFRSIANIDYASRDRRNSELGKKGEELVIKYEKELLISSDRKDLAEKVTHVSVVEGDGAGYDVRSYTCEGKVKHIEVKTTDGGLDTDFFISPNEIKFSQSNRDTFYLYRVFNCSSNPELYIERADFIEKYEGIPTNFRMKRK